MRSDKMRGIDASKYDIRVLWTGLKEEHVSTDAGVVEGYPLDPPDEGPWQLVDWGVETRKEKDEYIDRYWTLWVCGKTPARKPRVKKAKAPDAPQERPKKRGRKPKNKPPEHGLADHLTSDLTGQDKSGAGEPPAN